MTRNAPAASRIRISFTPLAHGVHGLPVVRFLPALYLVELMTCFAPGRKRKSAKVIKGVAPKLDGLGIGHAAIIQNFVFVWQVASGSNGTTNRLSARFFRFLRRPQAERSLMFSASSGVSSLAGLLQRATVTLGSQVQINFAGFLGILLEVGKHADDIANLAMQMILTRPPGPT